MNAIPDTGALHRVERGCGSPALLFLHHFGGSSKAWTGVVSELEDDHRCVMPDLRGFGRSDALTTDACIDDYADDVLDLVRAMDLERYALVGHSMGGKIAMAVAARKPSGLMSLVLLATSPPTPEPIEAGQRAHLLANQLNRAAAEQSASKDVAWPLPKTLLLQVIEDRFRCSPSAWRWWLSCGSREDIAATLCRISVPVHVISGQLDSTIPTAVVQSEVMARIPHATLKLIPDCGHLIPLEAPQAVARCIRFATRKHGVDAAINLQPPRL